MKLLAYDSYEDYKITQERVNRKKFNNVWVQDEELELIADYIIENIKIPVYGICHGVRNGYEVEKLRELTGLDVKGTDISSTAKKIKNVYEWDFHDVKNEWLNKFDFIYSNSWDHSHDPELVFRAWSSCLNKEGKCFIHWSPQHIETSVREADCFGISEKELLDLLDIFFIVEDILSINGTKIIVCAKNDI